MRIIPVIDLQGGRVVRGVGGRRDEYRPVVSRLTDSADPLAVARAFRNAFGADELYFADLDAIVGRPPACPLFATLAREEMTLWVDAGIVRVEDAACLTGAGVSRIVAGLETLAAPEELESLLNQEGAERVVFSLDLRNGQPLGDRELWGTADPFALASAALHMGCRSVLLLDVAQVGTGAGTATRDLCRRLVAAEPGAEIIVGGGIRDAAMLQDVASWGASALLVASALHDGRITRDDFDRHRA